MKEKILSLRALGKTYNEICAELGCSKSMISYYTHANTKKKSMERTNKRRKKTKDDAIAYKGGKCQICSYDRCKRALDFHHLDPKEKDHSFTKGSSLTHHTTFAKLREELDKCILVCCRCHREIHEGLIDLATVEGIEPSFLD